MLNRMVYENAFQFMEWLINKNGYEEAAADNLFNDLKIADFSKNIDFYGRMNALLPKDSNRRVVHDYYFHDHQTPFIWPVNHIYLKTPALDPKPKLYAFQGPQGGDADSIDFFHDIVDPQGDNQANIDYVVALGHRQRNIFVIRTYFSDEWVASKSAAFFNESYFLVQNPLDFCYLEHGELIQFGVPANLQENLQELINFFMEIHYDGPIQYFLSSSAFESLEKIVRPYGYVFQDFINYFDFPFEAPFYLYAGTDSQPVLDRAGQPVAVSVRGNLVQQKNEYAEYQVAIYYQVLDSISQKNCTVINLAIEDCTSFELKDKALFMEFTDKLLTALAAGRGVAAHCRMGFGRTGQLVSYLLLCQQGVFEHIFATQNYAEIMARLSQFVKEIRQCRPGLLIMPIQFFRAIQDSVRYYREKHCPHEIRLLAFLWEKIQHSICSAIDIVYCLSAGKNNQELENLSDLLKIINPHLQTVNCLPLSAPVLAEHLGQIDPVLSYDCRLFRAVRTGFMAHNLQTTSAVTRLEQTSAKHVQSHLCFWGSKKTVAMREATKTHRRYHSF